MADLKPDSRERDSNSANEDDRVRHLAETTDLSPNQARDLIRRHGNDPEKLEELARNFKAEG